MLHLAQKNFLEETGLPAITFATTCLTLTILKLRQIQIP